jgi:hypothetical protein
MLAGWVKQGQLSVTWKEGQIYMKGIVTMGLLYIGHPFMVIFT